MFVFKSSRCKSHLGGLLVTGVLLSLAGCGGGSGGGSNNNGNGSDGSGDVDTSGVSVESLRNSMASGFAQGVTSSFNAVSSVVSDSKVVGSVSDKISGGGTQSRVAIQPPLPITDGSPDGTSGNPGSTNTGDNPPSDGLPEPEAISDGVNSSLNFFTSMVYKSTVVQSGDVYTFDPNESQVCSNPDFSDQDSGICEAILSHVTFVTTVNKVVNNEVRSATTQFKYDASTFATTNFTENTGYYEIEMAGMHALAAGINQVVPSESAIEIPEVMQGSFRVAFTARSEKSGVLTFSVPTSIRLDNNAPGEETRIDIAATDKLLEVAADGNSNSMSIEVSLEALDLLAPNSDDSGNTYPVEMMLSALAGKVAITEDGNKLLITGLKGDALTMEVDGVKAASLELASLDAALDASGTDPVISLSKALDFNFFMKNVRGFFNSEAPATYGLTASATAPAGVSMTFPQDMILKVTGGTFNFSSEESGQEPVDISIPDGSCLKSLDGSLVVTACN